KRSNRVVFLAAQDNTIPVVAIIVSGVVAVLAPVIAGVVQHWLNGRAAARQSGEAQEQRNEERRAMAYVDLLALLQRFQLRMDRTFPMFGPPPPRPIEPTDEEREL